MSLPTALVVCTAIICVTVFITVVTVKGMSMGD